MPSERTPDDIITHLRHLSDSRNTGGCLDLINEEWLSDAASLLESQAAEIKALREEVKRLAAQEPLLLGFRKDTLVLRQAETRRLTEEAERQAHVRKTEVRQTYSSLFPYSSLSDDFPF